MTNREHFIATLQACYFGDRNAFNEIVRLYDEKENIIKEVREYIKELKNFKIKYVMFEEKELYASENDFVNDILEISDKGE